MALWLKSILREGVDFPSKGLVNKLELVVCVYIYFFFHIYMNLFIKKQISGLARPVKQPSLKVRPRSLGFRKLTVVVLLCVAGALNPNSWEALTRGRQIFVCV